MGEAKMANQQGLRARLPVIWWALLSVCFAVTGSRRHHRYCYTDDTYPYHNFASKTPYDYARGHFSHLELVPEGKSVVTVICKWKSALNSHI